MAVKVVRVKNRSELYDDLLLKSWEHNAFIGNLEGLVSYDIRIYTTDYVTAYICHVLLEAMNDFP